MAAAAVGRSMSTLDSIPVLHPTRRRTSVVEVIDVDSEDNEPIGVSNGPPSQSQGRSGVPSPDVISVHDSDDDDFYLVPQVVPGSNRTRTGQRPRLFSPPPPPPDPSIPDVPRVPRRYSGVTSLPMRQRPPPFPSLPVRARDQPFDFEANIRQANPVAGPSNVNHIRGRQAAVSPPELTPAPPSHDTPAMGLGGALMSFRTQVMNHNAMRRLYTAVTGNNEDFFGPQVDPDFPAIQMLLAQDFGLEHGEDDGDGFDHPARPYVWQEILFRERGRGRARNPAEDYKAEYTHPGKAESGFTFDFTPSSPSEASPPSETKGKATTTPIVIDLESMETDTPGAGPSTVSSSPSGPLSLHTLLVCAKCLDPLVLGAGLVGLEAKTRKVWALRCGHLIDGKCLDLVGTPNKERDEQPKGIDDGDKGKGKAVDWKGKGKARAAEEPRNILEANPIRSRLRSSALYPSFASGAPSSSRPARAPAPPSPPQPLLGKRKRTPASPAKSKIEGTYEWECPVAGCKRVHVSVKIAGVWVPEPDTPVAAGKGKNKWSLTVAQAEESGRRGAVAVFV